MIELPSDLHPELAPLAWLIGEWEGTGVIDYAVGEHRVSAEFAQRLSFAPDGTGALTSSSFSEVLDDDADGGRRPIGGESGIWRLARDRGAFDGGPGLLPPTQASPFTGPDAVERLRAEDGSFPLEVQFIRPDGVAELCLGSATGPRIDLATDAVVRSRGAADYAGGTRMLGLVDGHLLWAWDMRALGQDLRTHASARLAKR